MTIWFTRIYDRSIRVYVDHAFDGDEAAQTGKPPGPIASGTTFCGQVFFDKPVISKGRPTLPVCERCVRQIDQVFLHDSRLGRS
jgi:hypothetical protein